MTGGERDAQSSDAGDEPNIRASFEFFPPNSADMERILWHSIERLAPIKPQFVSVTYGAGGSTRERTHTTIKRIIAETDLMPAAHLTCVAAAKREVDDVVGSYRDAGVRHIVALRGDPPEGLGNRYQPHPEGYATTADLVASITATGPFEVSVSAYPEKHPESADFETDLAVLAAKVDAGASRAITQFFFDNTAYFRFVDRVRARGIDVPIVPGILPGSAGPVFRPLSRSVSKALRTIRRPGSLSLRRSPPNRSQPCASKASPSFTSTPSTGQVWSMPCAGCSGLAVRRNRPPRSVGAA